jgi:hypothetical protein
VYKPDGKPYPVAGMNQTSVNTISLTIVDPYTVEFTQYANGTAFSRQADGQQRRYDNDY